MTTFEDIRRQQSNIVRFPVREPQWKRLTYFFGLMAMTLFGVWALAVLMLSLGA